MTSKIPVNIRDFFKAYNEQLGIEARYFSDQVAHPGEKGRLNETHFAAILRRYLPRKFGIGTGFVASTNQDKPLSPQCDIIIYDALQNAPLYESDAFSIFPIEMVYAVIEVKTDISRTRSDKTELDDCMAKCAFIRGMAHESISEEHFRRFENSKSLAFAVTRDQKERPIKAFKGYFRHAIIDGKVQSVTAFEYLAPRFFAFAYKGWSTPKAIKENFARIGARHPKAHIHGVCIRNDDGGYYTGHKAFKTGSAKNQNLIEKDGFVHFLLGLPTMLETMLNPFPQRLGAGFDLVDLRRYHILSEEFQKHALEPTEESSN